MRSRNALLSLSFFLYFGTGGVVMPILPLILKNKGATGADIGFVMAAFPLAILIAAPLAAGQVERYGHVRWVLAGGGLLSLAGLLLLAFGGSWIPFVLGVVIFAFARAPLPPLLDWLTLRALGDESDRYGAIRLWGSFAFLLTAWVFGGMLKEHPDLPVLIGAGLLTLFVPIVLLLPEPPLETQSKRKRQGGNRSIVAHGVMWPLLIGALARGFADGIYDVGFALHIEELGHGTNVVAEAVALGVGAELLVLALAPALLERFGAMPLVLGGMGGGVLRFALIGLVADPGALVFVQALHGLSFAAFWTGAVSLIAHYAPLHALGSAQALLTASMGGLGPLAAAAMIALFADRMPLGAVFVGLALVVAVATVYCALRLLPAVRAVEP